MQKRLLAMGLMKLVVKPPSQKEQLEHSVRNHSGRFDREKLYKEVWAEPVALVAGSYSVSGVYLARVCRQLQVPVPPRGYWARVRSGQRVRKAKLPSLKGSRG